MRKLLFFSILIAVGFLGFYKIFESKAAGLIIENNLPPRCENAVKHAWAAGSVYSMLRFVRIPQNIAADLTDHLGWVNEWGETWVINDSSAEMAKDLYNNRMGAMAAQILEETNSNIGMGTFLVKLCQSNALIKANGSIILPSYSGKKLDDAWQWYSLQKGKIKTSIVDAVPIASIVSAPKSAK